MYSCGGLVEYNIGNIDNCSTEVKITDIGYGYSSLRAGGLVCVNYNVPTEDPDGPIIDFENNGITNSSSNCEIIAENKGVRVAGLVSDNLGEIKNCSSECKIIGKDSTSAAGLVAYNMGSISGCNAKGSISIENDSVSGGLVATNSAEIEDSYAQVNITGDNYVVIGGLVGEIEDSDRFKKNSFGFSDVQESEEGGFSGRTIELNGFRPDIEYALLIDNCYAIADISGKDNSALGGLVGTFFFGKLMNPKALSGGLEEMAVTDESLINTMGFVDVDDTYEILISNSRAKGTVSGGKNSYIGGITGINSFSIRNCFAGHELSGGKNSCIGGISGGNAGVISTSFFKGSVTGDGNEENPINPFAAGGLVGANMGEIDKTYANCDVIIGDNSFAGGLVGSNDLNNASISDSYATGNVAGGENTVVGGLIGFNFQSNPMEYDAFDADRSSAPINSGGASAPSEITKPITNAYYNTDYQQTVDGKPQDSKGAGGSSVSETEDVEQNIDIVGLTTIQMTGTDAISEDCMNFTADQWVVTESVNGKVYYPQLKAFNEKEISEDIKNSSIDSVTFESVPPVFKADLSKTKEVVKGDNITLKVKAENEDGSLITYQWYKNGKAIEGATSDTLTIRKAKESDEGSYSVTATNNIFNIKIAQTDSEKCRLKVKEKNDRGGISRDSGNSNIYSTNNNNYSIKENKIYFSDVNEHWAKDSIEFVTARELFSGTGEGVFSPDTYMTRGMLVTVLGRLWGVDINKSYQCGFVDVNNDAYYCKYIAWAAQNNIVKGTGDNTFSPDQPIKREELAAIIDRYVSFSGLELTLVREYSDFDDNDKISDWAKDGIIKLYKAGIINGKPGNVFEPQGMATRAEVASIIKFLFRIVELK